MGGKEPQQLLDVQGEIATTTQLPGIVLDQAGDITAKPDVGRPTARSF
ncbi:hypothetical protein HMPREF9622_00909 [Cutibacterium modestum HL037PA3]|nr:hypothetical protein HMPREF9621_00523 [Cutibacterium modestum HL037PA2]EFT16049.1 hypothetical protein HMPREF9622_00909 [Cutibacterium modestum HL037PA3]EGG27030.1 hypothetical protein PA08_1269 [Cutibacterium modestum P08]